MVCDRFQEFIAERIPVELRRSENRLVNSEEMVSTMKSNEKFPSDQFTDSLRQISIIKISRSIHLPPQILRLSFRFFWSESSR